jgi:hypothetical protein
VRPPWPPAGAARSPGPPTRHDREFQQERGRHSMPQKIAHAGRQLTKTVILGLISAGLYLLLYLFEDRVMEVAAHGDWYFVIPILIAFAFSLVHGAFTGHFWEILGIKAKK